MSNLNEFITHLPCSWLEDAVSCRKGNVDDLILIKEDISSKYEEYENIILSLRNPSLPSGLVGSKDLLISYYESPPAELNRSLVKRRNDHGLIKCPFCGNPKSPDTLDHFIPKDSWPEYSIYPNNLVPQCRSCAPVKGDKYYCQENGKPLFMHPFYFELVGKTKFKIHVSFNQGDRFPSFAVKLLKPRDVTEDEMSRLNFHLFNLSVKSRIGKFCIEEYTRWKNKLKLRNFDLVAALNLRLSEIPPQNHAKEWKSAFILGLLACNNALENLNSFKIKVNPEYAPEDEEETDLL
ncbi:HNH endonuclease [Enterobacteriaceae bacterium RIT702]|nr:HNH endonuclease [Enterobacteriaceae bacterium RIT702]